MERAAVLFVGCASLGQPTNNRFDANLGSEVRLTPSFLNPASSPGDGMWVMWTSQPLKVGSFSTATSALKSDAALIPRAMRASSASRLTLFLPNTFFFR